MRRAGKKRPEATQTLRAGCRKADPQTNKHTKKHTDRGDYNTQRNENKNTKNSNGAVAEIIECQLYRQRFMSVECQFRRFQALQTSHDLCQMLCSSDIYISHGYNYLPSQCQGHSVNNRTVEQLPLTASHPPLGCRAFISCTNFRYAFWVTMHL